MSSAQFALLTDGYKTFHGSAMHEDLTRMYGNFTNRSGRLSNLPNNNLGGVVSITTQAACISLAKGWKETFFDLPKAEALYNIKRILDAYLGIDYDVSHYAKLHDLGRLPITIKGVPEGTIVPYGVAPYTVQTSIDGFQWLALYIETFLSSSTWHSSTNATTAAYMMLQAKRALKMAGLDETMLPFMVHDFSMRGIDIEATPRLGYSHLAAGHCGSDTLPAIFFAEDMYGANVDNELVACSVKATEHSITTSYIMTYAEDNNVSLFEAEVAYARKLLRENPEGILSYVADSFDFWRFVTEGLDLLKEDILARDGTFVIRPDSGTPADVLCGTFVIDPKTSFDSLDDAIGYADEATLDEAMSDASEQGYYCADSYSFNVTVKGIPYSITHKVESYGVKQDRGDKRCEIDEVKFDKADMLVLSPEQKGLIQILAEKFGTTDNGTVRSLHPNIGAIYGDSITCVVQRDIYTRLIAKRLSPLVVLGVGSYSYQYVTRDTHGSAVKCTAAFREDGSVVDVCKDPKTDPNKKSAKGLLYVWKDSDGDIRQFDQVDVDEEAATGNGEEGIYITYMEDGLNVSEETLAGTRELMAEQLEELV